MKVRAEIIVSGVVQGVGYRLFAKHEAVKLSLSGTVKNLFDGRVQVIVEGENSNVLTLIKNLRIGPPAAHVSDTQANFLPNKDEFDSFKIISSF